MTKSTKYQNFKIDFNIDKTFNFTYQTRNCPTLFDERGNCFQEKITIPRWVNVRSACEYLNKEPCAVSVTTECGVTVYRGHVGL